MITEQAENVAEPYRQGGTQLAHLRLQLFVLGALGTQVAVERLCLGQHRIVLVLHARQALHQPRVHLFNLFCLRVSGQD